MSRRTIKLGAKSRGVRVASNKAKRRAEKQSIIARTLERVSLKRSKRGACVNCGLQMSDEEKKAGKVCSECKKDNWVINQMRRGGER
jgi:hypothetical protein